MSVILFTMNVKYCFFSSIDQLAIPNFFLPNIYLQWYQKKEKGKTKKKRIHLHINTRPLITWFINIMRQALKCTKDKQILSILYHCPSKCLLECLLGRFTFLLLLSRLGKTSLWSDRN